MVPRWTALGLRTAEQKFRRIKGYRDLPVLVRELRREAQSLDANAEAALYVVKPIRTTAAASQERLPAVVPRGAASSDSLSVVLVTFAA